MKKARQYNLQGTKVLYKNLGITRNHSTYHQSKKNDQVLQIKNKLLLTIQAENYSASFEKKPHRFPMIGFGYALDTFWMDIG